MSYETVTGNFYEQVSVIEVRFDVDKEKARGGGRYTAAILTYRDSKEETRDFPIKKEFLENPHRAELFADFKRMNAGDKVTIYKQRCYKTAEGEGKSAEELKDLSRYNVRRIFEGHIIPEECANQTSVAAGSTPASNFVKDTTGMETGHAINAARNLLTPAKAKDRQVFIKAAKALADLTTKIKGEVKEANPKMSAYDIGAKSGAAILQACTEAKKFSEVEDLANEFLNVISVEVAEHIIASKPKPAVVKTPKKEEAKAEPEAEKVVKEEVGQPEAKAEAKEEEEFEF